MKGFSSLAAGVIALGFAASPALALSSRTFVSGIGSDSGTCGLATPCRTFAYALTQTAPIGEIIVLTSAGYGAVTITQSVSIINPSNFAGVTVSSGNGITINAGASDSVTLRGLTVDGGGLGANGIVLNSGGALTVDQCNLMNFAGSNSVENGILIQPTSGSSNIIVANTTTSNNGNNGLYVPNGSGTPTIGLVVDRVSANNNQLDGISLGRGTVQASVSNSSVNFNGRYGFLFVGTASLDNSSANNNGSVGVIVSGGTLALGRSVIMNNASGGISIVVNSYKDNRVIGVSGTAAVATLY